MRKLHIITPVKDAVASTEKTIRSVLSSQLSCPYSYIVYNDFSTPENTLKLKDLSDECGFRLVNLSDLTDHPSPNYLMVLQRAQREALAEGADLVIVESDVEVAPDTLQSMADGLDGCRDCGIASAVTVDENGEINYPYEFAVSLPRTIQACRKHLSFCCALLTQSFLRSFDFHHLDADKNWFDVSISHKSISLGFTNYLFVNLPVIHRPHSSRPWKLLKYQHPLKYYWLKIRNGLDKI